MPLATRFTRATGDCLRPEAPRDDVVRFEARRFAVPRDDGLCVVAACFVAPRSVPFFPVLRLLVAAPLVAERLAAPARGADFLAAAFLATPRFADVAVRVAPRRFVVAVLRAAVFGRVLPARAPE